MSAVCASPVRWFALLLALMAGPTPAAAGEDDDFALDDDTSHVNEGDLVFLEQLPATPVHHHHTEIMLDAQSLVTGWARMRQCHAHLDPVPAAELVYNPGRIRALAITEARHIGRAEVVGETVQLEDVQRGARLCLSAESLLVEAQAAGVYLVRNGPFMRRFLDGYYPMRVSLDLRLPPGMRFLRSEPAAQPGFQVQATPARLQVEAWFEGRLTTHIYLQHVVAP